MLGANYMRRVVPAKRVDSFIRGELEHAITWKMLACMAGSTFGGNYKIIIPPMFIFEFQICTPVVFVKFAF